MGFFFEFVHVVEHVDKVPYIEPSLHPWDEVYLTVVNNYFDVFLDLVCEILLKVIVFFF